MRNVLACRAVASGRGTVELAVYVEEADCGTVEFRLSGVFKLGGALLEFQFLDHTPMKFAKFFFREDVVE